ncbi:MAG: glycosyltransferase family 4 protein [Armatimonadota bacterium]|nr:glycosyltransferase family 4 protein [Armatimonadota bacterium]MDR7494697.1 glycosyltransferase family 4 protein [Armatimonadota bacterium]MDR7500243.1 glycosyltransferase family 4 protein [Armatimonadota bacterium]MDR7573543.1 glycosyltransferase family 4 protein [Armatimonadota bacterium]
MLLVEPANRSGDWHYATMLSSALLDEGVDVRLATLSPFVRVPAPREVPVVDIGPHPPHLLSWPNPLSPRRFLYHLAKIRGLLEAIIRLRPHVVHFQRSLSALDFVLYRAIKLLGARIVYTIHTPLPPRLGLVARARLRGADLILTHAERTKQQLVGEGVPERNVVRIPHGNYLYLCRPFDMAKDEARRLLGLPSHARVVLFFGHIEWRKGLERLIEAFAILAGQDDALRLVVAGTANEDFTPYERLIDQLGIRERVLIDLRWIPYEEMQKYFNAASVVVLPYRRISQSGVIQLAYAYSRPLVVTDVGGISEVVREDGTGIVTASEEPEAIAAAVEELLADPERAAQMGRRGRQLAETKYAWAGIARQVAGCYEALVSRNGASVVQELSGAGGEGEGF